MRVKIISEDRVFSRMLADELNRRSFDAVASSSETGASILIVDIDTVDSFFGVPYISFSYDKDSDLRRPFAISDLVAMIKSRCSDDIKSLSSSHNTPLCDPNSNSVIIDDIVIHLTKQEYLLFELLYENAGNPVSKQDIFDRVWNGSGNDNKLRVYIKYIRDKIEPIYGKKVVFSVRDRGYALRID